MKSVLKWVLLCLVLLYAVVGFVAVPYLIVDKVPQLVKQETNGTLYIGDAAFNPFSFELSLEDIHFTPADHSEFVTLKAFHLNYELYSLLLGTFHFHNIALVHPRITVVKKSDGTFNFSWLQQLGGSSESNATQTSATLPSVKLDRFAIEEGWVYYSDESRSTPFEIEMAPIDFQLKNIDTSNHDNERDRIRLTAALHDGGSIDIDSRILSIEPFALEGTFDYEAGKLFTGWTYLQEQLKLEVADGRLTAHARFHVDTADLEAMRIDELQLALHQLRIIPKGLQRHHDLLSIESITLNDGFIEPMRQKIRLDTLTIDNVGIAAIRRQNGLVDWQEYMAQVEADTQETERNATQPNAEAAPWDLLLERFALNNLHVNFQDHAVTPKTTFQINRLDLAAQQISSLPQTPLHYTMNMQLNTTMHCSSEGDVAHTALDAAGVFSCEGIDLTWFNPYIDQAALASLQQYDLYIGSGVSRFNLNFAAREHDAMVFELSNAALTLEKLALKQKLKHTTLFSMQKLHLEGIGADTSTQEASIKKLSIAKPYLYASLDRNAVLNWSRIVVPKAERSSSKQSAQEPSAPWHLLLEQLSLQHGSVHFKDHTLAKAHSTKLSRINIDVANIDSKAKTSMKYAASMRLNTRGKIKARGTLQHTPLAQKGTLNLDAIHLEAFSPYVGKDHYLALKRGVLSLQSSVAYAPSRKRADLKVKGKVALRDFVLEESRDNTVLLAWNEIGATPFTFEYNPDKLFIKEIVIDGFYANAVIDANGSMNFAKLSRHPAKQSPEDADAKEKQTGKPFPVQVVKVALQNSSANFEDYSLPLHFKAYIHDFNGNVYGISSNQQETSSLELNGVVNQYGSAKLKGSFNAAALEKFTDLNLVFRNIDLVNMSPYSGKFIGQRIANGKLFLDLNYDIVDSQMVGKNSIIVKKLELGEDVESKDAINLPLGLAIALLEDSDGIIDLELPVSGDMNNPEFSYGHIIFQAFINLITKAVTAPFSLLGSMLGIEGDALEYVEFEPGGSVVLPPEQEKLDALAKALIKRPKLELVLHGSYNETFDTKALQEAKLLEAAVTLATEEGELFEGDARKETLETLFEKFIGDDALEALEERLEEEYKENDDAFEKAYDTQMIQALSEVQSVSAQELQALGTQRAAAIRDYLVEHKNIESDRIVVGETVRDNESQGKWIQSNMELSAKGQ